MTKRLDLLMMMRRIGSLLVGFTVIAGCQINKSDSKNDISPRLERGDYTLGDYKMAFVRPGESSDIDGKLRDYLEARNLVVVSSASEAEASEILAVAYFVNWGEAWTPGVSVAGPAAELTITLKDLRSGEGLAAVSGKSSSEGMLAAGKDKVLNRAFEPAREELNRVFFMY